MDFKNDTNGAESHQKWASTLHDHTHGITSDPLTQFTCEISALIHDTDNSGVSNIQLIKEQPEMGAHCENHSVAEQNSLELAWNVPTEGHCGTLHSTLFGSVADLKCLHELLVNRAMATDIVDAELKNLCNGCFDKAFPRKTIVKPPTARPSL